MKKVLCLLLAMCLMFVLAGCGSSYDEAKESNEEFANGYFTTIKKWGSDNTHYHLIYANDTKVIYLYVCDGYGRAITPIYNTDGTLQLYKE